MVNTNKSASSCLKEVDSKEERTFVYKVNTIKYALINLSKNSKAAAEITRYFSDNPIIEYPDVESYNKHLESFSINSYHSFFFR